MIRSPNEFYFFVTRNLGFHLPEVVPQEEHIETQPGLPKLVDAVQSLWPDQGLLLGLCQPLTWDVDRDGREVVVFPEARQPGSSNTARTPQEARVPLTQHELVAATVIESQAEDKGRGSVVYAEVAKSIAAYCEDQLVNGDGSKITGLLGLDGATSITKGPRESREDFYSRALGEYASSAGRKPTHIVLSNSERFKWHAEKVSGHPAHGFPRNLLEVPIITLDCVPADRGLIVAADDIVMVSSPMEWKLGHKNDELSAKGQSQVIVSFEMGLAIRNPEAIAQLQLVGKQERDPDSARVVTVRMGRNKGSRKNPGSD